MALKNEFKAKLGELWDRATQKLLGELDLNSPGPRKKFNKRYINRGILELENLSTKMVPGGVKRAFEKITEQPCWNIIKKGEARKKKDKKGRKRVPIVSWAKKVAPKPSPVIYSFWNKHKCFYVGRTQNFPGRLERHRDSGKRSRYLAIGNRIKVFTISTKAELPKAECLAMSLFEPSDNEKIASKKRYSRKCPHCRLHKVIRQELRSIFRRTK